MSVNNSLNPALAALRAKALAATKPPAPTEPSNTSQPITKLEHSKESDNELPASNTCTANSAPSSEPTNTNTTAGAAANIVNRLNELSLALQTANPNISDNLRLIHRALLDDPEQVTLLTLEQRATFFQGLMKQTQVSISAIAAKTRQTPKKDMSQMSLDDLL